MFSSLLLASHVLVSNPSLNNLKLQPNNLPSTKEEVQTIHCPRSSAISVTAVPSSFHSVMTATTDDGYAFGTFGLGFTHPEDFAFYAAEITEVNGFWRMACGYKSGGIGFTLQSRENPAYQDCAFENGDSVCEGTIEECALICPLGSITPNEERKNDKVRN